MENDAITAIDRLRLLMIMHLHPELLPSGEFRRHHAVLSNMGVDMRALSYLRLAATDSAPAAINEESGSSMSSAGERVFTQVLKVADQVHTTSHNGLIIYCMRHVYECFAIP